MPGGFPKSDLLGVTVALIHVVGERFLAVWNGLNQQRYSNLHFENCLCRTPATGHEAVFLYSKVVPHFWINYRWYIRYIAMSWLSTQMSRDAFSHFSQNDHTFREPHQFACPHKLFSPHWTICPGIKWWCIFLEK